MPGEPPDAARRHPMLSVLVEAHALPSTRMIVEPELKPARRAHFVRGASKGSLYGGLAPFGTGSPGQFAYGGIDSPDHPHTGHVLRSSGTHSACLAWACGAERKCRRRRERGGACSVRGCCPAGDSGRPSGNRQRWRYRPERPSAGPRSTGTSCWVPRYDHAFEGSGTGVDRSHSRRYTTGGHDGRVCRDCDGTANDGVRSVQRMAGSFRRVSRTDGDTTRSAGRVTRNLPALLVRPVNEARVRASGPRLGR